MNNVRYSRTEHKDLVPGVSRPAPKGSPRHIGSVLRCLRLVDALADSKRPMGVSELARALGGTRGSMHQQLQTLAAAGWVEQTDGSLYRLTLRALHIGEAALDQADLGSRLTPVLHDLATASNENAGIAVLEGHSALIVQRVEGTQALKVDIKVGTAMPLAESASGRVLIAFGPPEQAERLRADGAKLASEEVLAAARSSGYAVQVDEMEVGMSALAVPVVGVADVGVLALSLAAPTARFDLEHSLPLLRRGAEEITRIAGGGA
jgi:DNA-binding IclR family transcriptional regulator